MSKKSPQSVKDLSAQKDSAIKYTVPVQGHTFNEDYTLNDFIDAYTTVGFQATNLTNAIKEINKMLDEQSNVKENCDLKKNKSRTKIFFGCTSNMVTSGLRETICYLMKHKKVDVFCTTAGGIEEDLIKCMGDTYIARFDVDGQLLRDNGYNRVGNLVIPNENYVKFERWFTTILDDLIDDHQRLLNVNVEGEFMKDETKKLILTPSKLIKILGEKINDESSILYWCCKNDIPVYCPALTDGSIGDILTFYDKREEIKLDIVEDIYKMNYEAVHQEKTGVIVLGSGLIKHHILNANLFKNGADYCVLINNAQEFDGSDAGANISEGISWGKLKGSGVKVFGDASILFPLIVAATFAKKTNN